MQDLLKQLKNTTGVTGLWVYDAGGQVMHSDLPAAVEQGKLDEITVHLCRATESIEFHYGQWDSFVAEYPNARLLVRNLNPGGLVILTETAANLGYIQVSANVTVSKLRKMASNKDRSGSQQAFVTEMEPVDTGSTQFGQALPNSADLVSDVFMDELNKTLADYLGPASAILIKRTLRKMGIPGRRAPKAQVHDLIDKLEMKILRPGDRTKFHVAASKLIRFHGVDK